MKSPVEVREDHLFTFFILDEYSHGAFYDVVKRFRFLTGESACSLMGTYECGNETRTIQG